MVRGAGFVSHVRLTSPSLLGGGVGYNV